ncbi:MAG: hypothetical protein CM15mP51_21220 [Porticoccaceae bacterium]|nr:MAG: hypothetical protein CM15mP51_21220 [Porticoccaceae bacterium]
MTGSDGLSAYSSGNNLAFKPLTYFTCKALSRRYTPISFFPLTLLDESSPSP